MYAVENTQMYECATGTRFRNTDYGYALFVKNELSVIDSGSVFVLGGHNSDLHNGAKPRIMQYVVFRYKDTPYLFAHYHEVWYKDSGTGSTKSDGLIRITTEHGVSKVVFGGDLNLDLDTQAIAMLEKAPLPAICLCGT